MNAKSTEKSLNNPESKHVYLESDNRYMLKNKLSKGWVSH